MGKLRNERRSSGRLKRLNKKKKKVVDNHTRELDKVSRLASLENDNYEEENIGESYVDGEDDEEVYASERTKSQKKKKRKSKRDKTAELATPAKTFGQILMEERLDLLPAHVPTYHTAAAAPSTLPARKFCSVCGYHRKTYSCTRCGMYFCCLQCDATHQETRCNKFT